MGASPSKDTTRSRSSTVSNSFLNEKQGLRVYGADDGDAELVQYLLDKLNLKSDETDSSKTISLHNLSSWETEFAKHKKNHLVQGALAKNAINNIIASTNPEISLKDRYLFNVEVDIVGSPSNLNNQKSSGRCWIFATCNVLRSHIIKYYNLSPDNFQLSQSYLFFYDKLEKANFFLENILQTTDLDLDSRLLQFLFSGSVNDGGQWDMIVNIIEKYGIVPNEVFPDNLQATQSSTLNYFLSNKLREYALVLRALVKRNASKSTLAGAKTAMIKEVYSIIALALGTPPKPNDSFVWEFKDKTGKYVSFETSPIDFYKTHAHYNVSNKFSLINDPRNHYKQLFTVDKLNNVVGGRPIEYLNLDIQTIKSAAIAMLKNNEPIFFGSDVGKYNNNSTGVLDTKAYDYELTFNTGLGLSKSERLQTGSSSMTHAMVITGVHLDPKTNIPIRWKIENSWGDAVGDKGYFVMSDSWFDEYVFQIVTSKPYVDKSIYDLWKRKKYEVLPFYDPMGALA